MWGAGCATGCTFRSLSPHGPDGGTLACGACVWGVHVDSKVVRARLPVLASLAGEDWAKEGGYVRLPVEAGMADKVGPKRGPEPA